MFWTPWFRLSGHTAIQRMCLFLLFQHDLDFLMSPARTLDRYRGRVMKVLTGDDKLHGSVLDGIWCCCFQCCHRPSVSLDSSAGLARFQDIPGFCNRFPPVLPRWPRWSLYWWLDSESDNVPMLSSQVAKALGFPLQLACCFEFFLQVKVLAKYVGKQCPVEDSQFFNNLNLKELSTALLWTWLAEHEIRLY